MRIVILGGGQVGGSLAQNLVREDNDITLVDVDRNRLRDLQHRLDIQTVQGSASHPDVLIEAGIQQADMLIAVTNSDEINMMGCQIAYSLFRTPSKIARIRSSAYYQYPQLFCNTHIPVDVCISPEQLVMEHIVNLIDYPGTAQVIDFCAGKVLLATIKPRPEGILVGKTVTAICHYLQSIDAGMVALFREHTSIPLDDDTVITKEDELVFIASPQALQQVLVALGRYTHPNRRIIIAGGGHIGAKLAHTLETRYRLKIIEHRSERAHSIAAKLHKTTVLQGDIGDRDLLINENIEFTDVFCAVTNDDEANIMSCLQAKRLGTRHALALVNRNAYVDLINDSTIDHAISPQLITIGSILTKLRRGHMVKVNRLYDEAEAIELVVNGTEQTSQVIGRSLREIDLPPACLIAAVMREQQLYIASPELILQADDHVILLVLKKRCIRQIESLFQVNFSYVD